MVRITVFSRSCLLVPSGYFGPFESLGLIGAPGLPGFSGVTVVWACFKITSYVCVVVLSWSKTEFFGKPSWTNS